MPIDPAEYLPDPIQQHLVKPADPIRYPLPKRIALDDTYPMMSGKIIDEFERKNWFITNVPIISMVDSVHGGPALTYKYRRAKNEATATTREFNSEVSETYTEEDSVSTTIGNISSSFSMDRELMKLSDSRNELRRQLTRVGQGVSALLNEMVIRGDCCDVNVNPDDPTRGRAAFDGLDKIIRKESWHVWDSEDSLIDLTGLGYQVAHDGGTTESSLWMYASEEFMGRIEDLSPEPTFIMCNKDLKKALSALGRRMNTYQSTYDQFGHRIEMIDGIQLVDMGRRAARADWIIPTEHPAGNTRTRENPDGDPAGTYVTRAYVGSFGEDAIMGLAPEGMSQMAITPPDLTTSGHVKKWDVDMHFGMAVFSRHSVGMFTDICLPKHLVYKPWNVKYRPAADA